MIISGLHPINLTYPLLSNQKFRAGLEPVALVVGSSSASPVVIAITLQRDRTVSPSFAVTVTPRNNTSGVSAIVKSQSEHNPIMRMSMPIALSIATGPFLCATSGIDDMVSAASGRWGQWMLAKIVLFLGLLAMAAANRFRLTPSLERASEQRDTYKRSRPCGAVLETTMAIVILGLVARLGTLAPASAG